ncbi:MAG: aminodeoxychorismate lyase [Steroidobacteraceae bacterium]
MQYGDGLFETMMVRGGRIRFLALHQRRLAEGCQRLDIRLDAGRLWRQAVLFAAAGPEAMLKLLVTRGTASARGYRPGGGEPPRCLLYRFAAAPPAEPAAAPASVVRLDLRLGENPALAGIKHCNRLELVLAARQLPEHGAVDGLLASSSGQLVSGTMSNVFVRRGGKWMTPELDRCGIAGVMRAVVMREAAAAGQPVTIAALPFTALEDCEALCLSNVRLGLLPVAQIEGRRLLQDDWALRLRARIGELDE